MAPDLVMLPRRLGEQCMCRIVFRWGAIGLYDAEMIGGRPLMERRLLLHPAPSTASHARGRETTDEARGELPQ